MEKIKTVEKIAEDMFAGGLRSRDCETWDKLKKYDKILADEILEELAEIEVLHLNRINQ